jgi:hypothetical protein
VKSAFGSLAGEQEKKMLRSNKSPHKEAKLILNTSPQSETLQKIIIIILNK